MATTEKKKSFALGYSLVIHSILTYFVFGGLTTSGMNVWVPAFVGKFGWASSQLLIMATIASLIGVVGSILFGIIVGKFGAKHVIALTLLGCGIATMCFGFINNVGQYLLCMILFNFFGHGFCNIGSNAVIGNWYPRRKGFVLGITTMGLPGASFLFVPILSNSIGALGISRAFLIIGICIAILGVVSWAWIKDTPQEVGLLPDNGKFADEPVAVPEEGSKLSVKKVFSNKNAWFIAFAYGALFLVTQGMVSQTVSYLVERGFENSTAVTMLSVAAAIGIVGSFIWGLLDDRTGTRRASLIYAVWYIVTFFIMFLNAGTVVCVIGVILLGASLGGVGNLMPSMILEAYGPHDYPRASSVIVTVVNLIRSLAFFVMALGLNLFGGYRKTTLILLVIAVVALIFVCLMTTGKKKKKEEEQTATEAA